MNNYQVWSNEDVMSWLCFNCFDEKIIKVFKEFQIDGRNLVNLSEQDLKEMGINVSKTQSLFEEIQALTHQTNQNPTSCNNTTNSTTAIATSCSSLKKSQKCNNLYDLSRMDSEPDHCNSDLSCECTPSRQSSTSCVGPLPVSILDSNHNHTHTHTHSNPRTPNKSNKPKIFSKICQIILGQFQRTPSLL